MQTLSYEGDGTLEDGVGGSLASNCYLVPAFCTATNIDGPDPQPVYLIPDSTYTWEWNEQDAGPAATTAGAVDNLDADLGVAWDLNDGTQPWDTQETGDLYGRCDNAVADPNSKGCVDQAFIPTMYPSYAEDGAAADLIEYAEWNLPPYYGNEYSTHPTPLHRLQNSIVQDNNREIICGKSSFTPDSSITAALAPFGDTDSCDEFPFASTYESGAMEDGVDGNPKPYVTTGANCAQDTAVHTDTTNTIEPTDWNAITETGIITGTEPCIRAHMPNLLNGHVGSEYSALGRTARLIDKDAFWIEVTG
jgi:hypothetical protein